MQASSRYLGAMIGLAVGDALGTTVEFRQPGTFEPISDMIGGGPFHLEAGQWTDDTSMALCLAESLIQQQGFDPTDQMQRYVHWFQHGHLSPTGRCFDIGNTVHSALKGFLKTGNPYSGSTDPNSAGNGSLMRLAPIPLAFARTPALAIARSADMSRTTHGAPEAVDACRYFTGLVLGALDGVPKQELLKPLFSPVPDVWADAPLSPGIEEVASGSFLRRNPPEIRGTGYVKESLEAALWAFSRGDTYADCVLAAVNLGHDADTTGAICGQLAGAYYGIEGIPEHWRSRLAMRETIEAFAIELASLSQSI